jgi:hypothetical protein
LTSTSKRKPNVDAHDIRPEKAEQQRKVGDVTKNRACQHFYMVVTAQFSVGQCCVAHSEAQGIKHQTFSMNVAMQLRDESVYKECDDQKRNRAQHACNIK